MGHKPSKTVDEVIHDVVDRSQYAQFEGVDFGFENLALEGGGAKGIAYAGLILALEDLGILKKIKRISGTSFGAQIGALLALGATGKQISALVLEPSASGLRLSLGRVILSIPHMLKAYGFESSEMILQLNKKMFSSIGADENVTFNELYQQRGVELCLTGTNVTMGCVEYFHPKTSPNMKIAEVVRISGSVPIIYEPIKLEFGDETHLLVDGGTGDNYPIHAYDGWYLSMDPKHSFFRMLNSKEPPFGTFNPKTFGSLVFDVGETEINESEYLHGLDIEALGKPDTKKARENQKKLSKALKRKVEKANTVEASDDFVKCMAQLEADDSGHVTMDELREALAKCKPGTVCQLFGEGNNPLDMFMSESPSSSGKEKVNIEHFLRFVATKCGHHLLHPRILHVGKDITSFSEFLSAYSDVSASLIKEQKAKPGDVDRTIGIYTDYMGMADFDADILDKQFLLKQGWEATIRFLKRRVEIMNQKQDKQ